MHAQHWVREGDLLAYSGSTVYSGGMQTERTCPVCGKRWMVTIPERGALPIYCSRACSAKAARARAAARSEARSDALVRAIDDAIAQLRERHIAAAIRSLETARSLVAGEGEGDDQDATDH